MARRGGDRGQAEGAGWLGCRRGLAFAALQAVQQEGRSGRRRTLTMKPPVVCSTPLGLPVEPEV